MINSIMYAIFIMIMVIIHFLKIKLKWNNKKTLFVIILVFILCSLVVIFPIENLVYEFDSLEHVSYYLGNRDIITFCESEKSGVVIYKENETTHGYFYTLKKDDGYELPRIFNSERIANATEKEISIFVDRVKNTNDYYVHVMILLDVGSDFVLTDSAMSEFNIYEDKVVSKTRVISAVASINYSEDYFINFNDSVVKFN